MKIETLWAQRVPIATIALAALMWGAEANSQPQTNSAGASLATTEGALTVPEDGDDDIAQVIVHNNRNYIFHTQEDLSKPSDTPAGTSGPQFPPTVKNLTIFKLEEPTREGFNAAILVTFDPKSAAEAFKGREFTTSLAGIRTTFNDAGRGSDTRAGDGVYSALTRIDFASLRKDEEGFLRRLSKLERPTVKEFSGRSLVATEPFNVKPPRGKELLAVSERPVTLGEGIKAFEVNSILANLKNLPFTADESKVLAINDMSVVAHEDLTFDRCNTDGTNNHQNPDAPWSFKTLLANMNQNTGMTDQEFIHTWLANWMQTSTVNSFNLPARPGIVDYFPGWDGLNAASLDIDNLPFRLLAIVNRLDLAKVSYGGGSAGEIRFVFGLLDPVTCGPAIGVDRMTAILEYRDSASSCQAIQAQAQNWLALDDLSLGSQDYMTALKAITDGVTEAPHAAAMLNQIRTNDFAFDGLGSLSGLWDLREFVIDSPTGLLVPATIKQTPDAAFRTGNLTTAHYMEDQADQILCEAHDVPEFFNGAPFLGGNIEYLSTSFWSAPTSQANLPTALPPCHSDDWHDWHPSLKNGNIIHPALIQSEVRHKLSLNTCDDCHAAETGTPFTHINPVDRSFSGFMTGTVVNDPLLGGPSSGGLSREFNDLERRGQIIETLASKSCFGPLIINSDFVERTVPMTIQH